MSSFVKLGRIRFFYIPSNMCHLAVQLFNSCVPYWMDVFTRNWDESPNPINTIQKKTHLYVSNVTQISELGLLSKL